MTANTIATVIAQALESEFSTKTPSSGGKKSPSQRELVSIIESALCAGPFSNLPFWLSHYIAIMDHVCPEGLTSNEKHAREKLRQFSI